MSEKLLIIGLLLSGVAAVVGAFAFERRERPEFLAWALGGLSCSSASLALVLAGVAAS